jgi:hypothetical protein
VKLPRDAPCQEAAGLLAWNGPDQIPLPPRNPRAKDLSDHVKVAQQQPTAFLHCPSFPICSYSRVGTGLF